MQTINIHNAKTHLSKLVEKVSQGEEVVICKAGKPIVKLVQYKPVKCARLSGAWKGKAHIAEDFDELPESFMAYFRGDDEA